MKNPMKLQIGHRTFRYPVPQRDDFQQWLNDPIDPLPKFCRTIVSSLANGKTDRNLTRFEQLSVDSATAFWGTGQFERRPPSLLFTSKGTGREAVQGLCPGARMLT